MTKELKKQPRFNNGRMYVQVRNLSLVGLRDLPEHLKTGSARAQLTPIFSILLSNIEDAFAAQMKGEVASYIERIELKPKFSTSKLDVRTDANPDNFGYIEDMAILKQLPYEYEALLADLAKRFDEFKPPFIQNAAKQAIDGIELLTAIGVKEESKGFLKNELIAFDWLSLDSTNKKDLEGVVKSMTRKLLHDEFGVYHAVEVEFCKDKEISVVVDGDASKSKCPIRVLVPYGMSPDEFANSNIVSLCEKALDLIANESEGKTYRELIEG